MQIGRRQFLLSALGAPAILAQQPGPTVVIDRGFGRVTKFAEGVYVNIADGSKGPQCLSNGGVIAGHDGVLIVEGHFQPAGAALEVEAARMVSNAPIRGAVNTHYHLDHSFGNLTYAQQKIPILASERAPALMKEKYATLKGVDKAPLLAPLERSIAKASSAEKQHFQSDLGMQKWMFQAIDRTTLAYPDELLRDSEMPKIIDLGGMRVAIEYHPGHTPTDLIVQVMERDVVFTGDLLFYRSYPVAFDADMVAWRKVLDRFAGYGRNIRFVPGHGPICGQEAVRDQQDLFDDFRSHAERMIRDGASVEEASRRFVVPKRFQDFEIASWDWCVSSALQSYYSSLKKA